MTYNFGLVKKSKKKTKSEAGVEQEDLVNSCFCNGVGFVLVLVEYGSWFLFVFHFCSLFLVCKIGDRGAVVRFIGGLLDIHLRC